MQKETRENFLAVAREDGFRMKLHAVHGELAMAQCHNFAILAFCYDLEARREGTSFDDQRVVSTGFKRRRQIGKEPAPIVSDHG